MQTFLPYPDFKQSAKCLDNKRLGKQRVEAFQILKALNNQSSGWRNHPAVLMWKDFETTLSMYMDCMIKEWINRGFNNTMKLSDKHTKLFPMWLGLEEFHAAHRSNLLRKDPIYYSQWGWTEPDNLPYFWPTKNGVE